MTPAQLAKITPIQLLILDVDGTLTDGQLYYGNAGEHLKAFHVHDGLGLHLLQRAGLEVAIITAKSGDAVANRMRDLQIKHVHLGCADKRPAYDTLKASLKLADHQIAYVGDDLPDLALMKRVGFAVAVKNAPAIIAQHADYITKAKPGRGAVREVCELILEAQQKLESVIQSYLN